MLFHFPLLHKIFHSLMSSFNSSSDRFRTSIVSYLTDSRVTITCFMFIHMFFVNVQSCSVLNACYLWIRYFVIQSCFLSTMPPFSCRHFLMIFTTRTFIFAWVTIAIFVHCIITASWDVLTRAAVLFSPHRRFRRYDIEALAHTAAQIASSQLYLFGDSLPRTLSFTPSAGTTHCC